MNKNQSAGMYIVLAIVILVFVSSVFMAGPTTSTSEISYSNFLERLANGEFKKVEQGPDFLIAVPKNQPEAAAATTQNTDVNPFAIEKKTPQIQYRVLTPNDPELVKKLEAANVDISVKKPSESSQFISILLTYHK